MELGPVRGALQTPEVDDVADEVQELAFVPVEKVEQGPGLTARRAQVCVADPDGAVAASFVTGSPPLIAVSACLEPALSMRAPSEQTVIKSTCLFD
jgi:hypothetical protein